MARFKCTKDTCSLKDQEIIVEKTRWIWSDKLQKLVSSPTLFCQECKSELEFINNTEMPNLQFNKFDSLSTAEKRKIIQKRSSDHMRKTGEAKDIAERKRQIIQDNKRMVGGK